MIKIKNIIISRFRSILKMDLNISDELNMISLCGKNNVGKTNTLRAINIFFNPEEFEPETDIPKIKKATGGNAVYPKIEITFEDTINDICYYIIRDFKDYSSENSGLKGYSFKNKKNKKIEKVTKSEDELKEFLDKITFVNIESINTFIPDLISNLTENMINIQYDKVRFTKSKKDLKDSYDNYVNGLQEILDSFSDEISNTFKNFQESWSVKFKVPRNSETFRALISDDVTLTLNDNGSEGILDKGAGLQRLATILLQFEMLNRMSNKRQMIVCIDEPDAYLHDGLKRKLKDFLDEKSKNIQLFYTTHSKIFIDPYKMENVFLLDANLYNQFSARKNKEIFVTNTYLIDISTPNGYERICNHLGIEYYNYDLLHCNNIFVEGDSDKIYLTELGNYFGLDIPNIESLNGADNAQKYLDFYDSYYKNHKLTYTPSIKVLFDNDVKGRDVYSRLKAKKYSNINVELVLLNNYLMNSNLSPTNNTTNNEIEDFVYPEVVCEMINMLLRKKEMRIIITHKVCEKIKAKSFASKGILELCEHEKNARNPERGVEISFSSSSATKAKEGMAKMFSIQGNQQLQKLLSECDMKYPEVKKQMIELFKFS